MLQGLKHKELQHGKIFIFPKQHFKCWFPFSFNYLNQTKQQQQHLGNVCFCKPQIFGHFCEDAELVLWFRHKKHFIEVQRTTCLDSKYLYQLPQRRDVQTSCLKYLVCVQCLEIASRSHQEKPISSGFTLVIVEKPSWAVATGLPAFLPVISPPSPPPPSMNVRWWICNLNVIWPVWYVACDLYKCECISDLQKRHLSKLYLWLDWLNTTNTDIADLIVR